MTLEGWAYPTQADGSWRAMVIKETSAGLAWALYPIGDRGLPSGHATSGSELWASASAEPKLNAWTHYAVTYDGLQIRLYINGVLASASAQTGSLVTSAQPLRFGGDALWPEWFKGRLDELRIYNRALSATEIRADMDTPVRPPVLKADLRANKTKKRKPARVGKPVKIKRYRAKHRHGRGGKRPRRAAAKHGR